jgi:hypothetical protein
MNAVERVLYDELTHLLDRIAGSVPAGSLAVARSAHPTLRVRLDEVDAQLATVRATLLDDYARWRHALDDLENLWALAAWHSTAAEQTGEQAGALAA